MNDDYNFLEEAKLIYYVYNLNWHLPKEYQDEAIEVLSNLSPEQVDFLILDYGKACWFNAVSILEKMGYPRIKKAIPRLVWLLQDINWPGALEGLEIMKTLEKEIIVTHIEEACVIAIKNGDPQWLEFLKLACDELNISRKDFVNQTTFSDMIKLIKE